jgi:RNA polymerase primary sigma factor
MRQLKISKSITARDSRSFEKYLQEVGKVDLVTTDEEIRLAGLIREGNQSAIDRLTKANLRFVVSVAKQYQHNGLSLSDMISEGNIGLIKAAHRFDETRGFKFISYAVWWIRQSIMQAIQEQGRLVRLPSNKIGLNKRVLKTITLLEQEHERTPTNEEVGDVLEMKAQDINLSLQHFERHLSLDTPNSDQGTDTLLDVLESTFAYQPYSKGESSQALAFEINRSLSSLTKLQKEVVCSFFGLDKEPLTLNDIGSRLGLTGERVRQIKTKAVNRLRLSKSSVLLKAYL